MCNVYANVIDLTSVFVRQIIPVKVNSTLFFYYRHILIQEYTIKVFTKYQIRDFAMNELCLCVSKAKIIQSKI